MKAMFLGISIEAPDGVATRIRNMFKSFLSFQTDLSPKEGVSERLIRVLSSPIALGIKIIAENPAVVHINRS